MEIYIFFLVLYVVFAMLSRRWNRPYLETLLLELNQNRRDNELECSTHRLKRIRLSMMPEEIRGNMLVAGIVELQDLIDRKQRPIELAYPLWENIRLH
jgi:hypothetical protein